MLCVDLEDTEAGNRGREGAPTLSRKSQEPQPAQESLGIPVLSHLPPERSTAPHPHAEQGSRQAGGNVLLLPCSLPLSLSPQICDYPFSLPHCLSAYRFASLPDPFLCPFCLLPALWFTGVHTQSHLHPLHPRAPASPGGQTLRHSPGSGPPLVGYRATAWEGSPGPTT